MSESAVIVWERQALVSNRVRHARYIQTARMEQCTSSKLYWLNAAREVRLAIVEGLDMLHYLQSR